MVMIRLCGHGSHKHIMKKRDYILKKRGEEYRYGWKCKKQKGRKKKEADPPEKKKQIKKKKSREEKRRDQSGVKTHGRCKGRGFAVL